MSCSTCGSNARCGCSTLVGVVRTGCSCNSSPCTCCQNVVQAAPRPAYQCAPQCAESHQRNIYIQQFATVIKIQDSWNVPACGETAVVTAVQLTDILVGSYIWNVTYGYFEVTAFNPSTNQITIINNCNEGNAAEGTNVPSCTNFNVGNPPCVCPDADATCVAIDFTAPAVDDCIDITVTNLGNITAGSIIAIGTARYSVPEIISPTVITICNDLGLGFTPGTSIIALDAAGNYQYCILVVDSCCTAIQEEIDIITATYMHELVIGTGCLAPGNTNTIRTLMFSGGTLTIEGAAEHYSEAGATEFEKTDEDTDISGSSPGNTDDFDGYIGGSADLNIGEITDCRYSKLLVVIDVYTRLTAQVTPEIDLPAIMSINLDESLTGIAGSWTCLYTKEICQFTPAGDGVIPFTTNFADHFTFTRAFQITPSNGLERFYRVRITKDASPLDVIQLWDKSDVDVPSGNTRFSGIKIGYILSTGTP